VSAPATPSAASKGSANGEARRSPRDASESALELVRVQDHLIEAYVSVYDGYSLDRVLADPTLSRKFAERCRELGVPGTPGDWNHLLLNLRKRGKLAFPIRKRTEFDWLNLDEFLFASEIAWREMKEHGALDSMARLTTSSAILTWLANSIRKPAAWLRDLPHCNTGGVP
jgi:site-specific DNA-methyltransferase (adenine-specific)